MMGILRLPGKASNETVSRCTIKSSLGCHLGIIMTKPLALCSPTNPTTICLKILRKFKDIAKFLRPIGE